MNMHSFAASLTNVATYDGHVIWLRSKEHNPLGMQAVRVYLAKQKRLYSLAVEDSQLESIKAQCATSFLGEVHSYYLGDVNKHLRQKNSAWYMYFSKYQGPHVLIFWAEYSCIEVAPLRWLVIDLPEAIDAKGAWKLVDILYADQAQPMKALCNKILNHTTTISFESFCRLGMYAGLIDSQHDEFMKEYASGLIATDTSLFLLSQYLLGKKKDDFYRYWASISKQYPIVFWISFWSDQFWRATLFVRFMHTNQRTIAYEIARSKLPFSFTKTDWTYTSHQELQKHYTSMCDFDFALKNGGSDIWLELFFTRWFTP